MKYAFTFTLFGGLLICLGASVLPIGALAIWAGVAFATVGMGYFSGRAGIFGKQPDGTMKLGARLLLGPYLAAMWVAWRVQRLGREDPWNVIQPRLYLGRRPIASELPPDVEVIVDLTSEFPVAPGVAEGRRYHCLPTLDDAVPDAADFEALVETIAVETAPVYVHCAVGHGRSAMFVVALLLRRGVADRFDDALELVRKARPAIGLKSSQRALAASFAVKGQRDHR